METQPTYTPCNCSAAYQLNWSLSVFGRSELPSPQNVIEPLNEAMAKDGLRILEFRTLEPNVAQFFISSQPSHTPASVIRSLKGRWQYAARGLDWIKFRRNYFISSVGTATSEVLDNYIAGQTAHHDLGRSIQSWIETKQFHDADIDPVETRRSSYGQYVHALQIVISNEYGWHEPSSAILQSHQDMIRGTCHKHGWLLSRIGMLSNHMHIVLAAGIADSPESVALALMNNMAFAQGNRPLFRYSYYVGTFGRYDRGAIWNTLRNTIVSEAKQ